jgi:hypothetical protein
MSATPPTDEPRHDPDGDRSGFLRAGVVGLVLVAVVVVFAFGRAIINGDYFGECDHVVHQECRVVHVLGVVMHRDVTSPGTEATTTPEPPKPEIQKALAHEYTAPCHLYVVGHSALVGMTGPESVANCEHFVAAAGKTPWTTESQTASESRSVVCEVTNIRQEHATVTDTGGHEYGSEACKQLSGEGWG